MVVEFLVATYCEQSSEINRRYRMQKKKEREEKAERKRRLYFPGKYPADFARVICTNFKYNWKNYVLFIACGTLCATFLTTAIGMNQLLSTVHSKESLILGIGLQQILLRSLGLISCTTVLVTAFVFSYYIKSRMDDYRMFTLLGIRSRTLSYMIGRRIHYKPFDFFHYRNHLRYADYFHASKRTCPRAGWLCGDRTYRTGTLRAFS